MATGMIHIPKPLIRLIREDPGVEGCAWFSRRQEDGLLHVLANIIRLACNIILAPPFMVYPIFKSCIIIIYNLIQTSWVVELVDLPGAVLHNPPKDNTDTSAAESGGANQPIANNIPPENDSEVQVPLPPAASRTASESIASDTPLDPGSDDDAQYLITPVASRTASDSITNIPPGDVEVQNPTAVNTPAASRTASANNEVYEKTNFEPRWMLQASIRDGSHQQIDWTGKFRSVGYTALSYDMEAAYTLFKEAGEDTLDPEHAGKGRWSLRDRRRISEAFLKEYCSAVRDSEPVDRNEPNESLDRGEFVWLDELCISAEDKQNQDEEVKRERNEELGRMPDIYRGAKTVVAFCDVVDCDHTTLDCSWGKRLFTLSEILHANKIKRMTRKLAQDKSGREIKRSYLYTETAQSFRERMMHHAAMANKWHLHAILRQSNNSGSDTWQMAIHALIVEAIRRDRDSGYENHEYLAKGLNGLLPRRARLQHLKGKDGWADLAWLLELNQGFYNQAALAAVCCLPDKSEVENGWLGPPIEPRAGNERLEPLVTAFAVSGDRKDKNVSQLNIIGAQTIGLHPCLKRDGYALYRNPNARIMKRASVVILVFCWIIAITMVSKAIEHPALAGAGAILFWLSLIGHNSFRLLVGTMHLQRNGWVFLRENKWNNGSKDDIAWGTNPEELLGQVDPSFKQLAEWGDEQMIPKWDPPGIQGETPGEQVRPPENRREIGHLVDLRTGIKTRVVVSQVPNAMVVLGVHGSGVTYMLLNRPNNVNEAAVKVGMANLPPYTLAATEKCGSVRVGPAGGAAVKEQREKVSIWDRFEVLVWSKWLYTKIRELRVGAATDMT